MEVWCNVVEPQCLRPPHIIFGLIVSMLLGAWPAQALEMSVGKVPFLEAVNGSTVMLPCEYSSCIGIENLYFNWQFNDNGTMQKVCESVIPSDEVMVPNVNIFRDRVEFVGKNHKHNISILLWNITFEDGGQYTCFGRNPKEKGRNHSAVFTLIVVEELRVVDNTLTIIIASAVGGAIALLMGFMLIKNLTLFVLSKLDEKNKECLVTSSGIDNTENGLSRAKGLTIRAWLWPQKGTRVTQVVAQPATTCAQFRDCEYDIH
ncbi:sodium channel, voltage-gated, type IV, beta b [Thalassophryne amazonica]|uniref:sodium channel, voltage-gated, type IV, beta b n=1 Tax=Thalassophryne amazonica TaxID=390379 RepID=UPI0014712224|nr:sodium channel, voltage-gated, type IV, beta b [Thalassophryne amazonica]XP_034034587.1 sodium channel, voltage-gated, type IV, beta b [Thalassophryne amazonica]